MSQHDYNIANNTGAGFRSDLNDVLAAILSNNSGPTEPTVTVAYMFWVDTGAGVLKQRNAANSAWINKGTLTAAPVETTGATFTGDISMTSASIITAEGAAVASGTNIDIWATDGNTRHITGNTEIESMGSAPQAGATMWLVFDGTPNLKQSTNLNLNNGGSDITIEAGDVAIVYADTTTQLDIVVFRKSGQSVSKIGTFTQINLTGELNLDGSAGTNDQIMVSRGDGNTPEWIDFPSGGFRNIQVFTSSGTFNVPDDVDKIKVTVIGGGGGGGGVLNSGAAAGGGGAGGTSIAIISVTPSDSIAVTIGAAGGGGSSTAGAGGTGGTSSFGAYCTATGGSGGAGSSSSTASVLGGLGGIGSSGNVNFAGQCGESGIGGGAGGAGGSSTFGAGGRGRSLSSTGGGSAGLGYGAGGGGSYTSGVGGAGTSGVVVVEY